LWDGGILAGAEHMALDEALLLQAEQPTLRWYRWTRAEISFGYPMRWADVSPRLEGREAVRRWTGGGLVEHGDDLTIAVAVPKNDRPNLEAPLAFYERVHRAITDSLDLTARLATSDDCSCGSACFDNPAQFDVLREGRKIAGGAIRRSREGLLYQGSIQGVEIPGDFIQRLARNLAEHSTPWTPSGELLRQAGTLRETRYATSGWLRKR
jgi:lipoate-protein ligase A